MSPQKNRKSHTPTDKSSDGWIGKQEMYHDYSGIDFCSAFSLSAESTLMSLIKKSSTRISVLDFLSTGKRLNHSTINSDEQVSQCPTAVIDSQSSHSRKHIQLLTDVVPNSSALCLLLAKPHSHWSVPISPPLPHQLDNAWIDRSVKIRLHWPA